MVDRTHRELTDVDIAKIAGTYHAWRGDPISSPPPRAGEGQGGGYADIPGFCKAATLDDIRKHGHVAATWALKPPRTTASRSGTR
jgi:type I restriction enzyme M protein